MDAMKEQQIDFIDTGELIPTMNSEQVLNDYIEHEEQYLEHSQDQGEYRDPGSLGGF